MRRWRRAGEGDLPAIARLSGRLLAGFPERDAVFAERLRLSPEGCHVLDGPSGIEGYILSHPWRRGEPPPLDTLLGSLPAHPDCWYLHDLGLAETARGTGAAAEIVGHLATLAAKARLPVLALVAVNRSAGFWSRQGFAPAAPAPGKSLRGYGPDAAYMERPVP